jgi:hypothetical protein
MRFHESFVDGNIPVDGIEGVMRRKLHRNSPERRMAIILLKWRNKGGGEDDAVKKDTKE